MTNMDSNNQDVENNSVLNSNPVAIDFLESKLMKLRSEKLYDKKLTLGMRIFFGAITLVGFLGVVEIIRLNIYISVLITVISGLIFAASFASTKQNNLDAEIKALEKQLERKDQKSGSPKAARYFDDLVAINLRNLEDYYELVKNSNKKSFNSSLIMSVFGVLLISSGLIVSYLFTDLGNISYVVTASGVLVEIISGLMFYLYNRTVLQLKEYHDSLLDVQNILLCFKLVEDTNEESIRVEVMKQMIEFLVRRKNI
ncbi:MAG: TRADD-N-associated membrane domain-containing protein [Neobacillus sp.]